MCFPYSWIMYAAFFYCEIDGSSLCLQCDMIVHVGGKRTHRRYLLLRQRIEVCLSELECWLRFCICFLASCDFNFSALAFSCSFQVISLAIQRSQGCNPLIQMEGGGNKVNHLSSISRITGSLLFQFQRIILMVMQTWIIN